MIRIGIQEDLNIYDILKDVLDRHYIPYFECSTADTINKFHNNNIILLYKLSNTYIMKENQSFTLEFDVLLLSNSTFLAYSNVTSKVCITHSSDYESLKRFDRVIFYGFDKKAHVTYSSIMEKNNINHLVIYVQNSFKTLYNSKMIKFEFSIKSNIMDVFMLDSLLSVITLCLYLDLRFEKNEYINLKGESIYAK